MDHLQISKILEQISQNSEPIGDQMKIIKLPDYQTMHIEQSDGIGHAIIFNEYHVDGKVFWAGFSTYTETVFVSQS